MGAHGKKAAPRGPHDKVLVGPVAVARAVGGVRPSPTRAPTLRPTPLPQITLQAGVRATALPKITITHAS